MYAAGGSPLYWLDNGSPLHVTNNVSGIVDIAPLVAVAVAMRLAAVLTRFANTEIDNSVLQTSKKEKVLNSVDFFVYVTLYLRCSRFR